MMISQSLAFLCATMPLASGLWISRTASQSKDLSVESPYSLYDSSKYAYVIMWIQKNKVPKDVDLKVMSSEEEEIEMEKMKEEGWTSVGHPKAKLHQQMSEVSLDSENAARWTADGPKHALQIAAQFRQVGSKYPVVIMTNAPKLIEIKNNETLQAQYPNVRIQEIEKQDWLHHQCSMAQGHMTHFQKISVFGMTQFEKVIWLDMDTIVKQNIDGLFEDPRFDLEDGDKVWGQTDNWNCDMRQAQAKQFCSGMMMFKPKKEHVPGMMQRAREMGYCWGDQKLIASYFSEKHGHSKGLFPLDVVNWGHCPGNKKAMVVHDQVDR